MEPKNNNLLHLEANNNSRTFSTASTVTTSSTSPQEASTPQALKTISKNTEKLTAAEQSQNEEEEEVFLPTAIVPVDNNGRTTELRDILDSRSQSNLITDDAVQHLGLKLEKADARVFELGIQEVSNNKGSVTLILKSKEEDFIIIRATVFAKLSSNLPLHNVNVSDWTKLQDLNLVDPIFNQPSTVDLIIGARHYEGLVIGDNRINEPRKPFTYRRSCYSWLVIGHESQVEKGVVYFSLYSFDLNKEIYSNFGKLKKFRQQQSGHQKNRNAKITLQIPQDAIQKEDSL